MTKSNESAENYLETILILSHKKPVVRSVEERRILLCSCMGEERYEDLFPRPEGLRRADDHHLPALHSSR